MIKYVLKSIIPPIFLKLISRHLYGLSGNYGSWKEAQNKCLAGYADSLILKKVTQAAFKVKNGEAVFERDSVTFNKIQYSFPLLAALKHSVCSNKEGYLNVLDFGGSLGSSYFQNKFFLNEIHELNWCIVEQEHFVEEGTKNFANNNLHFFKDIDSVFKKYPINLTVLSGSLQFIEHPYTLLKQIIQKQPRYIFIDKTPVFANSKDRLTIQKISQKIYKAQYPCWIFNESTLLKSLLLNYELLFDGETLDFINIQHAAFKFYFLKRKN